MFIKTFKTSRAELIIIIVGLICFVATLWYIISSASSGQQSTSAAPSAQPEKFLVNARTSEDRVKFLSQFGWEVDPEPLDVREVVIPAEFDEMFSSYNDLQKTQGFDLEKCRGCRVKKWEYSVINYPDGVRNVKATLLIRNGEVVGGDISAGGEKKFTHSLLYSQVQSGKEVISPGDNT